MDYGEGIYRETDYFLGKLVIYYHPEIEIVDPNNHIYHLSVDYSGESYSGVSGESGVECKIIDLLTIFLEDPKVSEITGLIIGMWEDGDSSQPIVEFLVNSREKLPNLRVIFLGEIWWDEYEISWIRQSDLSPLLNAYPDLEHLQVRGGSELTLGTLKHDRLKTLIIETGGLSVNIVRQVCHAKLPALEHLELWLGNDDYGWDAKLEDLSPILNESLFPKLTYLGLKNSIIADEVATAVAIAPIMSQIKVLDLSLGNMGDVGAAALLSSPYIHQLSRLDLHHHYISDELVKQLKNLVAIVDANDVREPIKFTNEEYRYIAISE